MKKLILLAFVGFACAQSMAQSGNNSSIVFTQAPKLNGVLTNFQPIPHHMNRANAANKGTATMSDWFDMGNIMYVSGGSASKRYYYPIFQDSTVNMIFSSGTPPNGPIYDYGMGLSFDPTDSIFMGGDATNNTFAGFVANTQYLPSFRVTYTNSYSVDSISIPLMYKRNNGSASGDSIYVQIAKTEATNPFGIYEVTLNPASWTSQVTPDGKPRYAAGLYDRPTNRFSDSIPSGTVIRVGFAADATFAGDTLQGGYSRKLAYFALPSTMNINAGEKLIVWVTFKSGATYPLGTLESAANTIRMFGYDFPGTGSGSVPEKQNMYSFYTGLMAQKNAKYGGSGSPYGAWTIGGHYTPLPSFAFTGAGALTDMAVRVTCNDCYPISVEKFNANTISATAYPNPATSEIRIPFTLKKAADVNITLTNTVGVTVATQSLSGAQGTAIFSAADLPSGVYFFTLTTDGGTKTGRVVVAH